MVLFWILGATILVSIISLVGIFSFLLKDSFLNKALLLLVGFSAGTMIGASFFHLLPEALEHAKSTNIFLYVVLGFSVFFLLERYFYWRHCHDGNCEVHAFAYLNLIGDGMHNFIDGMIIAVGFVADIKIGFITTLAVISHEIPQEMGDFAVLVFGGLKKTKALFYNFLSALTAVLGALLGYFLAEKVPDLSNFLLPFACGGFIYIASSDLIPQLHTQSQNKKSNLPFLFFILGILLMFFLKEAHN